MREIKFRAWDKNIGAMFPVYTLSLGRQNVVGVEPYSPNLNRVHFVDGGGVYRDIAEVVLMQFTGLKDKNGKEIYEGDILIERGNYPSPEGWSPKPFKFPNYEEFSGGGYEESVWGIGYVFNDIEPELQRCEVIGDIYENPELLDNK